MLSIQKLFAKSDKIFSLLERSADEANRSIEALNSVLAAPDQTPSLEGFHQLKEGNKAIGAEINLAMQDDFSIDMDREDIELLSEVLYKIPKTVEKIAERFIVSAPMVKDADFSRHTRLLQIATRQVNEMVKQLRRKPSVEQIKEMNEVLQQIEGDADELILEILGKLYSGALEPTKVIALKDLYELIEKVVDRCRDAGNAVTHIVIKNA
jgi:uncharacterized protein